MPRSDDDFLQLARDRFAQAQEADHGQRDREREDLQAYAGNIWTQDELDARSAQQGSAGMPPIPARPSLNIPLLQEPIKQVTNNLRAAELGVEIVPVDDFPDGNEGPDDREIELREGLVRRIQRESDAADARIWAAARAVQAGRGYWGVMTQYLPGKTWDQDIRIIRFYNQASVSLDPSHESPDGSDAEWAFVGNDVPWAEYKARYGAAKGNRVVTASNDDFRALGDEAPGWFTVTPDQIRVCRVVDYWYTTRTTKELVLTRDGVYWADDLPAGLDAQDRREVIEKAVKWAQLDGAQVLDRTDWLGPDVPIIKVLGEELQPYDQERRAQGMVRPAKDSIKGFAAMVSKLVETIGLTPIPPFMGTPEQFEGFEKEYQLAASRTFPMLHFNAHALPNGQVLPPPTRTPVEMPVQAIAGAIQLFRETIQSTTAVHDPSLGRVDPSLKSGRAIRLLQQQSQQSSSGFGDNYQRSLRREGHIVNNLLYPVYGKRPGRIARIVTAEGTPLSVAINGPSQQPKGRSMTTTAPKEYQLTDAGSFNVIVKVGRSFDSVREEEASTMGDLLSANPVFMTWFGDLFFKNSDGPGHLELSERAKVMLDPKIQQMLQSKEQGTDLPPQVQAFIQQLQQRVQEAEQIMQQQQQELQTKQAAAQVQLQIAQLSADKDIRLRQMQDANALAIAKLNLLGKGIISDNEAEMERLGIAAEESRTAAQLEHDARMQGQEQGAQHAHDVATLQLEHDQELQRMQHEQDHTLESQQQAADLAPEPESESEGEPT